jgi:hypothetical protein
MQNLQGLNAPYTLWTEVLRILMEKELLGPEAIKTILELADRRAKMLEFLKAALERGDDAEALRIARAYVGLEVSHG